MNNASPGARNCGKSEMGWSVPPNLVRQTLVCGTDFQALADVGSTSPMRQASTPEDGTKDTPGGRAKLTGSEYAPVTFTTPPVETFSHSTVPAASVSPPPTAR